MAGNLTKSNDRLANEAAASGAGAAATPASGPRTDVGAAVAASAAGREDAGGASPELLEPLRAMPDDSGNPRRAKVLDRRLRTASRTAAGRSSEKRARPSA